METELSKKKRKKRNETKRGLQIGSAGLVLRQNIPLLFYTLCVQIKPPRETISVFLSRKTTDIPKLTIGSLELRFPTASTPARR